MIGHLVSFILQVKEQCLCTLWNLSVAEDLRLRIAKIETLPVVISSLADEDLKMKESAGGLLATLALSESNHEILVELGIIPKLVMAWLEVLPYYLVTVVQLFFSVPDFFTFPSVICYY